MRHFTQPNGTPAEVVQYLTTDPNTLMTGTLHQQTDGTLWRVAPEYGRVGPDRLITNMQWIKMTKRDGSLKAGESRWAVEAAQ